MKKILILFAHPAYQKSRINKLLIEGLNDMEGVTFHDLYQWYPELDIEIKKEQKLVEEHDIIIFHHPFYWYSSPAILKEWQDLVLEHGWAYGGSGKALKGKCFMQVITTGGDISAYKKEGYNHFTIRHLLSPFEQTANLCQMKFLPPLVTYGTFSISKEAVLEQKEFYNKLLCGLRDDIININDLASLEYANDYLANI